MIKVRVTKQRREFGSESVQMIQKDALDNTWDLKQTSKSGQGAYFNKRKVLEIGLQAANQMKTLTT